MRSNILLSLRCVGAQVEWWDETDLAAEVPVRMAAGDAVVHHVGVLQRAQANTDDRRTRLGEAWR